MNLNGITKSAILLITIGANQAVEILKELSFSEIQNLIKCMLNLEKIPCVVVNQVISEFNSNFSLDSSTAVVNRNYVVSLSQKVLGDKNSAILLDDIKDDNKIVDGIKQLNMIDPKNIAELIQHEHPQIITTMLVYLDRNQASAILSYLEEQLSLDVVSRIVDFTGIKKSGKNELIKIINYLLQKNRENISKKGGITTIVELLKLMTYDQEKRIISKIQESNKELANVIKSKVLSFEDIAHFDDLYIQRLIKEVKLDELAIALQVSSELLKEKILKNMSEKDSNYLRSFFIKKSFISTDVIEKKQKDLLNVIKKYF
ncbi:MAG: FliG C-terminal domain-containing protein [Buchnera aphidicola (Meitanaphis microgallis)]